MPHLLAHAVPVDRGIVERDVIQNETCIGRHIIAGEQFE